MLRSTVHHISAIFMEEIIEPPIVTNKLVASRPLSHELVMIYYREQQKSKNKTRGSDEPVSLT